MRIDNKRFWWVDNSPVTFKKFYLSDPKSYGWLDAVWMRLVDGKWRLVASHYTRDTLLGVCKMASCKCRAGWTLWSGRCYKFMQRRLSWLEARQQCRRMTPTADLVSIGSLRENNYVFNLRRTFKSSFWIGYSDREQEGKYLWNTGEGYTYTNWHPPTEPNGSGHREDCVTMLSDRTWADTRCAADNLRDAFVCEHRICDRGKTIRPEQTRKGNLRIWRPDDELRCPEGWSRGGNNCYSKPTAAGTFSRVQSLCANQHPQASIALISSLEENDKAFFAAGTLPMWVDYGTRAGRVTSGHISTFTNWIEIDDIGSTDCAIMYGSAGWHEQKCEKGEFPALCQLTACTPECPPGWYRYDGRCYRKVMPLRTLAEAAAACQKDGGYLASIQSQEENDFITTLAFPSKNKNTYLQNLASRSVWIGASRVDSTSKWTWSDCANWTLSRWYPNDGDDPSLTTGTCGALHYDARWRDNFNCQSHKLSSVCEMDPCRVHFGPLDRSGCPSKDVPEVTEPTAPASPGTYVCPKYWTKLGRYCYGAYTKGRFEIAREICNRLYTTPAQMASVQTPRENKLLLQVTRGKPVFLGLTEASYTESRWLDGSNVSYTFWNDYKPKFEDDKKCTVAEGPSGRWQTRSCNDQNRFVCRLPAVRNVVPLSCPDDGFWNEEAGTCFSFYQSNGTAFQYALQKCTQWSVTSFRLSMATIRNAQEEAVLQRLANGHDVWIGLARMMNAKDAWRFMDDLKEADYVNWRVEPASNEVPLCAALDGQTGGMVPRSCTDQLRFFCQAKPAS